MQYKGHQNWVKVSGEYLTFPGGGTQFKNGALHYIDKIQEVCYHSFDTLTFSITFIIECIFFFFHSFSLPVNYLFGHIDGENLVC